MKKALIISVLLVSLIRPNTSPGQTNVVHPLTADSLASGNYKNELSSFYQLAFNDLTGPNKALAFTSNPFAIMARANSKYYVDTNYYKLRWLRNFNFNFNLNLDSTYQFNGCNIGFKYALINNRDQTVSKTFIKTTLTSPTYCLFDSIDKVLSAVVGMARLDTNIQNNFIKQVNCFQMGRQVNGEDTTSFTFTNFSDGFKDSMFVYLDKPEHNVVKNNIIALLKVDSNVI